MEKSHDSQHLEPENTTMDAAVDGMKSSSDDDGGVHTGDENKARGNWSHHMDFLLSCIGYAVGLGNVWRFPYLCYSNGGGAFLIPYFLSLAFAGMPLFFMEINFGQYCSLGIMTCWRALPILKGLSYGQLIVNLYLTISYGVIITYAFYYFFVSMTSELPWIGCGHSWNTIMCSELVSDCLGAGGVMTLDNECLPLTNLTQGNMDILNITRNGMGNFSLANYSDPFKALRKSPSEEYWIRAALQESDNMNETGSIVWPLALCLLLTYVILFLCLSNGIKSTGKAVYFTATFPYVILIILLVRGVTLPGSEKGIYFLVTPHWEYLAKPKVWLDAVVQIFYSLGASTGGMHTLASYNKFHNNTYRDTMIVTLLNSATSIIASFAIFSILGYMAHIQGKEVSDVVRQGFGLAFVAYPEVVARMPAAPLWSMMFFFMLITLGIDSEFVDIERFTTALVDEFPGIFPKKRRIFITLGVCMTMMLGSLSCVTQAGPYWMSLMDNYGANIAYVLFAFLFTAGISWLYGTRRFTNDIRTMIGDKYVDSWSFQWWRLNWMIMTPLLMGCLVVFNCVSWTEPTYNGEYPPWARAIGWMMIITTLVGVPGHAIFELLRRKGSFMERLRIITSPLDTWGPALIEHRRLAVDVHARHGTKMGGVVDLDAALKMQHHGNKPSKYTAVEKEEMEAKV